MTFTPRSILVGRCFGIGNAVISIPLFASLRASFPSARIDALVGSSPDDVGAAAILRAFSGGTVIDNVHEEHAWTVDHRRFFYDDAIMSIPYDGRWREGYHFSAQQVVDGRPRPSGSVGLESWKQHESLYQLEAVDLIGGRVVVDPFNACRFVWARSDRQELHDRRVFLGVGYKRDVAGFWAKKNWGLERFQEFVRRVLDDDPDVLVVSTGNGDDVRDFLGPIARSLSSNVRHRFRFKLCDVDGMIDEMRRCSVYVGHDTGTMHVAAACGMWVVGMFFISNSDVKSRPLTYRRDLFIETDAAALSVDRVVATTLKRLKEIAR